MKILHICAVGFTVENLLKPQIDYFLDSTLKVEVACSPGVEVERLQQQGYVIHPIQIDRKISPVANLKSLIQLTQLMQQHQYDAVHVHTPIASVLGRIAAKLAGVKRVIYTAHGFPFHDQSSPKQYRLYFTIEKLSAKLTNLILTQSYEDFITAKQSGLCSPKKVLYLGNGVDIDHFDSRNLNPSHQTELRQSLGIPNIDTVSFRYLALVITCYNQFMQMILPKPCFMLGKIFRFKAVTIFLVVVLLPSVSF